MKSKLTLLLFLAHLLVCSLRAVSGNQIPVGSKVPETALLRILTSASSPDFSFTCEIPSFTSKEVIINGRKYIVPDVQNAAPILESGAPDLLRVTASIQLPALANVKVELTGSVYQDYEGIEVAPSRGNPSMNEALLPYTFGPSYNQDAFYPGALFTEGYPFIARNTRYETVQLYPFQYNPVTKVLRVYSELTFRIIALQGTGNNPLSEADLKIRSLKELVHPTLNAFSYPSLKSTSAPSDNGRMLIVCPGMFRASMEPFIQWKAQCGISCEVVDAAQFADAPALAAYVKEYYYQTNDLSYLLLVGDAELVPPFILNQGASDNLYAYLSGDDHYPDILVGRFSASTQKDLETQLTKSIRYEKEPGQNNEWLGNVTGLGSTMSPGDDGEADYQHVRNLIAELNTFTYTSSSEFFDGSQGGLDAEGDPATKSVLDHLNQGTGLILYTGHGATSTWATGRITRSALSTLQNTGKYPFIWSAACETGNFAGTTCLAETWMRASSEEGAPLGAVAALMASGTQTTYPPMEAQDAMVDQLTKVNEQGMTRTYGGISVSGLYRMNDVYGDAGNIITDTWILFGDPSLQVRTSASTELEVEHENFFGYGQSLFRVSTPAVSGRISITCKGSLLGSAEISGRETLVPIAVQPQQDSILITVTALNVNPYIALIPVVKQPAEIGNLFPVNHSRRIPIATHFSWDEGRGGKPAHYLFFLGTDNPPTNLLNGLEVSGNDFKPSLQLEYLTTYFWRVEAVNQFGSVVSKVNSFETIYGPDEDFETTELTDSKWLAGGTNGWMIDMNTVFGGSRSCRSGNTGDMGYSSLVFPCEVQGCDFVGFWYKLSAQSPNSKLQFIMDGLVREEWTGSSDWTYTSMAVEPGIHQLEWRFISDQVSGIDEFAWLDDISLPLHGNLHGSAGDGGTVCEGTEFNASASLENYNSITWESDGDGSFNDNNLLNPAYLPGELDLTNGNVQLRMKAFGFDGCPVEQYSITLYPVSSPVISLPTDTLVSIHESIILDASSSNAVSYAWLPGNEIGSTIRVDSAGMERGSKTITLIATSQEGCSAQKSVRVHFTSDSEPLSFSVYPNPCTDHFTIEPESGAVTLNRVELVDESGKIAWQETGNLEVINNREFKIPSLPSAKYFLLLQNDSGKTIRPLVIH